MIRHGLYVAEVLITVLLLTLALLPSVTANEPHLQLRVSMCLLGAMLLNRVALARSEQERY